MNLKEIYLYPDLVEYENEIVHPFRDQSRSICNYLERQLKPIKFNAKNFKRICFIGKSKPDSVCFVNSSKVLIVEISFDENQYKSLKKNQLNPYFSQLLTVGIKKCQKQFDIPVDELLNGLKKFCENGYINKWVFKTKLIKDLGFKCTLRCELTLDEFHLNLVITKKKNVIFSQKILDTVPDEIVFTPMFKDVKLIGNSLIIIDKFDNTIFSVAISELKLHSTRKPGAFPADQ